MLNPNSEYYLSFNLGYPNKLEAALRYTGEALMVHGACSSSGCYALTDEGVSEIYSVAREALKSGQGSFQVQAFPFRMTAKNMAKNRSDSNFAFWSDLKQGYDIFEVTRRQPKVSYCEGRYVFDKEFEGGDPVMRWLHVRRCRMRLIPWSPSECSPTASPWKVFFLPAACFRHTPMPMAACILVSADCWSATGNPRCRSGHLSPQCRSADPRRRLPILIHRTNDAG